MFYLITGIIAFLVIITSIISIHEFGHLLVAKRCGVYCYEYSIGLGKLIWQRRGKPEAEQKSKADQFWGETDFSIRLLPFGGYVRMAGDDEDEDSIKVGEDKKLTAKGIWAQTAIMIAGVVMNFILAFVMLISYSLITPKIIVEDARPVVEEVILKESPLKAGDEIVKITTEGKTIEPKTQTEITEFIQYYNNDLSVKIKRDGEEMTVKTKPIKTKQGYTLGYRSEAPKTEDANITDRVASGVGEFKNSMTSMTKSFGMLAKGRGYDTLSGPVAIGNLVITITKEQPALLVYLTGILSLNIGFFNLLPIPALDGGRIFLLWLDRWTKGRIKKELIANVIGISFVLLMILTVVILGKDIINL